MKREVHKLLTGKILAGLLIGCFLFIAPAIQAKSASSNIKRKPEAISMLQEKIEVTGRVTDEETGEPLPGVNIVVQGTTAGTTTDMDGNYSIEVAADGTLLYSFVGYGEQALSVEGRNNINITMIPSTHQLEQVNIVAVGYGTMQKANVTGSVDNVDSEFFDNRPLNNITQGLEGAVPNLQINLLDGKPTRGAEYKIRGETSIGQGGDALILIDGVEGNPEMLNPNDIKNISVLKGAAASAIYGARGSFGVVLIETKSGSDIQGDISVNYNMNYGLRSPKGTRDRVTDGYTWAKNFDEAYYAATGYTKHPSSINKTQRFSQDYLNEFKERSENPENYDKNYRIDEEGRYRYYGSTDWYDLLYKDYHTSISQNLSIAGNTEKLDYYLSGRYQDQEGLFRYNSDNYSKYNLRAKGNMEITDWLNISNNTSYSQRKYHQPLNVGEGGGIWRNIKDEGHPTALMFNPNGTLTHSSAYVVGDFWYGKNREIKQSNIFRNTTGITAEFFDDKLTINGDFTFSEENQEHQRRLVEVPFSRRPGSIEYVGSRFNNIRQYNGKENYLAANIYGEYENTFGDSHYLKLMTGFNYEENTFSSSQAQKNGILYPEAENIALTVGDNKNIEGDYYRWRIEGQFFRINYNYKERYLLEVNGRYDINSKFPQDQQTGFFPSASVGYRISEEPFWNIEDQFISRVKIRGSYGSLGNGNVDPYTYLELFNIYRSDRIINGKRPTATSFPTVIPEGLTWETSTTKNIGIDIGFLSDRLTLNADYYQRLTTDMYTQGLPVPAVFGANVPKGNYADMKTKGWEIQLRWNDEFNLAAKPFNYNVRIGLSDNTSTITSYPNPDKLLSDYYEGQELGEIWGFETEGLFQREEEIENHADQSYIGISSTGIRLPGDIKYKDLNNDGKIDKGNGRVSAPGDFKIIGNSNPRYTYNLNLGANWNNISFSAFIQGVGKQDWFPNDENPFWGQYNRPYNDFPKFMVGKRWSEDNPDAYFPRFRGYQVWGRQLGRPQSRYILNVAYIRLKNIQIGYQLPESLMSKMSFIEDLSIYLSGENIWNWSPLYKVQDRYFDVGNIGPSDPDASFGWNAGKVNNYPRIRTFSLGVSATF